MSVAVLFGLNYPGTNCELRGCANDVANMAKFLEGRYSEINQYTDIDPATKDKTTRRGMMGVLRKLCMRSRMERLTEVFIHYSGHGSYVRDRNHDEKDGRDEALVPSDYNQAGMIVDDQINRILSRFDARTRVVMVMDCCHSGTIADLVYRSTKPGEIEKSNKQPLRCKCVMISGCMDSQTSADAYNMKHQGKFSGALTTCLLDVLPLHNKIADVHREVQALLKQRQFTQLPLVCGSFDFLNENFIPAKTH